MLLAEQSPEFLEDGDIEYSCGSCEGREVWEVDAHGGTKCAEEEGDGERKEGRKIAVDRDRGRRGRGGREVRGCRLR